VIDRTIRNDLRIRPLHDGAPNSPPEESTEERVEFHALMPESKVTGRYYILGDRLSDALNRDDRYALTDVRTLDLVSGIERFVPYKVLMRAETLIIVATGPRGNPRRRFRTTVHPVTLHIGPYKVTATIHMPPGGRPIPGIYHRQIMVPLTDARVEYPLLGRQIEETYDGIVINRHQITSILRTDDLIPAQLYLGAVRGESDGSEGPGEGAPDALVYRPGPSTPPYLPRPRRR
jgi:hypothetical protein